MWTTYRKFAMLRTGKTVTANVGAASSIYHFFEDHNNDNYYYYNTILT